jgi:hypothetical protein
MRNDFDTSHLTPKQRKIANAVIKATHGVWGEDADGGGCRAFYTPQEWRDRGESYGTNSELVICHDGGSLWYMLDWNSDLNCGTGRGVEAIGEALRPLGYYVEQCCSWYSAVYKL